MYTPTNHDLTPEQADDVHAAVTTTVHETVAYARALLDRLTALAETALPLITEEGSNVDEGDRGIDVLRDSVPSLREASSYLNSVLRAFREYEDEHGESWSPQYSHERVTEDGDELAREFLQGSLEAKATEFRVGERLVSGLAG